MPRPVDYRSSSVDWCALDQSSAQEPNSCAAPEPIAAANVCPVTDRAAPGNAERDSADHDEISPGVELLTTKFELKNDQFEATVGAPPILGQGTVGGLHLSGRLDYASADVHLGSRNEDGSKGENIGAMATAAGVEATVEYSGWSLTAGLSLSAGASISSGEGRDIDHDGLRERCFQVSFGDFTLGECDEL